MCIVLHTDHALPCIRHVYTYMYIRDFVIGLPCRKLKVVGRRKRVRSGK